MNGSACEGTSKSLSRLTMASAPCCARRDRYHEMVCSRPVCLPAVPCVCRRRTTAARLGQGDRQGGMAAPRLLRGSRLQGPALDPRWLVRFLRCSSPRHLEFPRRQVLEARDEEGPVEAQRLADDSRLQGPPVAHGRLV